MATSDTVDITFRTTKAQQKALEKLATKENRSRSNMITVLLDFGLRKRALEGQK